MCCRNARLLQNQFGDHIVDLFDKDIMATVTKNSQILNGNAAISDGFRVAHSYLAKSEYLYQINQQYGLRIGFAVT
jgi:hypothetical protein